MPRQIVETALCPEHHAGAAITQKKSVVHWVSEVLLATKVSFRRLHRGVPEQELNLLKLTATRVLRRSFADRAGQCGRSFVVARINPLRWIKGNAPPLEDVLKTMRERVAKFNVEKIRPQDLASAAGSSDEQT